MDGEQAERLRGTFDAILFNGSPEDLRAFLAPLDESTRAYLYASRNKQLRGGDLSPLDYCICNLLADHAAVLFEYGALATASLIQKALSKAACTAALHHSVRILEVVVAAARWSQGSLTEVMRADSSQGYTAPSPLDHVFWHDFAPALGVLLDAHLGNGDTVSRPALVRSAAGCGALACLQLLHERCSRDEWTQLLTPLPGRLSESPLACAFKERMSDAFEYLLSFHSLGGADGPDLLPQEAVNSTLAILAEHAPDRRRQLQVRIDAARVAYDSWDARTQIETALALLLFSPESDRCLLTSATDSDSSRAVTALSQLGFTPSQEFLSGPQTEATAEAVLDALAATEATESQGGAADAAIRRQLTAARVLRTLSESSITDAVRYVLFTSAAPILIVHDETMAKMLTFCGSVDDRALGLRLARVIVESAEATEATAVALNTRVAAGSWELLSCRVESAQVGQAQLFIHNGADVFETRDGKSLLCSNLKQRSGWLRPSQALPPPIADPTVAAATVSRMFASADAARAHAAAAAAEEERLFATVREDPDVIRRIQAGPLAWEEWAISMNSVLGVRWVWQCMCERDPKRARAYLQPSASRLPLRVPLSEAIGYSAVRHVRFFTSLGARMTRHDAEYLAKSCLDGDAELSWALLDALPADAAERASILEFDTPKDGHTAVAGVALAVLRGHRFSPPLAEALLAAGATVPHTLLFALCDPRAQRRPVTSLPGELARALRWALEHFKHSLESHDRARLIMCQA